MRQSRNWLAPHRTAGFKNGRPALIAGLVLALVLVGLAGQNAFAEVSESTRLIEILKLEPGMFAADVGAGKGNWTEALARAVGPSGHVFSTEVETELVEELSREIGERGLTNVTTILGDQFESGLPAACCDAILLRMVYHHFEDPPAMRASLLRALRPGGILAVIDINPQRHWRRLDDVPDRGGHGIEPEALIRELTADGLDLVSRHDDWNGDDDRYCAVFRLATARAPASEDSGARFPHRGW